VISASSLASAVSYVADLIEKGRRLEAKGREIAVRRGELISGEDVEWADEMYKWHISLEERAKTLKDLAVSEGEFIAISDTCGAGSTTFFGVHPKVKDASKAMAFERNTPLFKLMYHEFWNVLNGLRAYCERQRKLTGRSVSLLLVDYLHPGDYSWSNFARDFTSCFSLLLDWVAEKLGSIVEVTHRVYASTRSLPVAVECARDWGRYLKYYAGFNLFDIFDYDEALCFVRENETVFRLGKREEEWWYAHAEFAPLSARVKLILRGKPGIHMVFARLSEHYGCTVVEQRPGEYTVVEIPRGALADFFRGVLALVVSMDKRIIYPELHWGYSHTVLRNEYKRLSEQGLDLLEVEFRLCIKAYELARELFGE
jgi:hypothetical protein